MILSPVQTAVWLSRGEAAPVNDVGDQASATGSYSAPDCSGVPFVPAVRPPHTIMRVPVQIAE